ncbi:tetratricopeptide repeat protein [Haloferula sp.]|uniref:tetratricopeptide repeat protein n=1 Tax=Haloferula sp. TaxID=2497595 RepID=UPI003C7793EF
MKRLNRKRKGPAQVPTDPSSALLAEINRLGPLTTPADFLKELDEVSEEIDGKDDAQARLLAFAADCLGKQGRHSECTELFQLAWTRLGKDSPGKAWFRLALGSFQSLLRAGEFEAAMEEAEKIKTEAAERWQAFQDLLRPQGQGASIIVPPRPYRPTVVLTRLGTQFLDLGFPSEAIPYFEEAILLAPNGASRARQGLATIRLATGAFEAAERLARESLQMGRFQAKTVSAWTILARARHARGQEQLFEPDLLRALRHHQKGSVLARSVLTLSSIAHSLGSDEWMAIAKKWRSIADVPDHVIDAELIKLEIANARRIGDLPNLGRLARKLLKTPDVVFSECRAAIKLLVRCHLKEGQPSLDQLYELPSQISRKLGQERTHRFFLVMGQGAVDEGNPKLAKTFLKHVLQQCDPASTEWMRATGTLGRLATEAGEFQLAARHFMNLAASENFPARSRVRALVDGLAALREAGEPINEKEMGQKVDSLLDDIDDPFVMLDLAKQFVGARAPEQITKRVITRGRNLAEGYLKKSTERSETVAMLKRLSLREYYEFRGANRVLARWEAFDREYREWLWSRGDDFWEYLTLVYLSYRAAGRFPESRELAEQQLAEAATPPEGYAWLGTHLLTYYVDIKEIGISETRQLIERIITAAPHHTQSYLAYHYAMVDAIANGANAKAISHARSVQRCLGRNGGMIEKMRMRGVIANLVLSDLGESELHLDFHPRNDAEQQDARDFLETDIRGILR